MNNKTVLRLVNKIRAIDGVAPMTEWHGTTAHFPKSDIPKGARLKKIRPIIARLRLLGIEIQNWPEDE